MFSSLRVLLGMVSFGLVGLSNLSCHSRANLATGGSFWFTREMKRICSLGLLPGEP